jgi:high-affinity nickel-transport protein
MTELLVLVTASLLLGMRHATDPDHVFAVATIVSRERSIRGAARIGVIWGLGHGFTLALVGGTVIALRLALSPRVELSLEFAVALMLICLGTLALVRRSAAPSQTALRPFAVGFIHGLAGSAAASVLVLSAVSDVRWAMLYLVVFALGTLVGMAVMTSILAAPSLLATHRSTSAPAYVRSVAGALTLAFGGYLAFRIGIVDGLFVPVMTAVP